VYWRNLLIGLLMIGIGGGCSTDRSTARVVNCRVQIDSSLPESAETGVRIWMAAVPGEIFGRYSNETVVDLLVDRPGLFALPLAAVQSGLARQAVVARTAVLHVEPADTRIARLATLGGLTGLAQSNVFLSGFRDPKSGDVVVLFYVDRACVINGTFTGGRPYTLRVAHPGLNWIAFSDNKPGPDDKAGYDDTPRLTEPRYDLIYSMKQMRR
jgi:hypothetical protein